jgi:hypothetical protein
MPPKKKKATRANADSGKEREPPGPTLELTLLFDALRSSADLPTMYAALKFTKVRMANEDKGYEATARENDLLKKASLAVPYLMYKKAVDLLTRPRSMGGLAFSSAKADTLVKGIFEEAGFACCGSRMTEKKLMNSCSKIVSSSSDARKILNKLLEVGEEARSKVPDFMANLYASAPGGAPDVDGEKASV